MDNQIKKSDIAQAIRYVGWGQECILSNTTSTNNTIEDINYGNTAVKNLSKVQDLLMKLYNGDVIEIMDERDFPDGTELTKKTAIISLLCHRCMLPKEAPEGHAHCTCESETE